MVTLEYGMSVTPALNIDDWRCDVCDDWRQSVERDEDGIQRCDTCAVRAIAARLAVAS